MPGSGSDALALDAARLDWAFMEAFDAPDSPPFDMRVLASAPEDAWPRARIHLHASLRLLALGHPVHTCASRSSRALPSSDAARRPTHVVVYRDAACFLRAVAVDPVAFELLGALGAGTPLGEACEAAARASGKDSLEIGAQLGGWFQQWTAAGWIRAASSLSLPGVCVAPARLEVERIERLRLVAARARRRTGSS